MSSGMGNRSRLHAITKNYQLYLLLLVPIVYILVFKYLPMYGAQIAFRDFSPVKGIMGSPWVGFRYFVQFFNSYEFWRVFKNTLGISVYSIAVGFPFPIFLALLINNVENRIYKKTVQMVTYAPHFISTVVMAGIVIQFLSPKTGIINQIIQYLGGEPTLFMGEPSYFWSIYVISDVWQHMGWNTIIYLAALASVDMSQHEAAIVDGASRLKRVLYIDIPHIMPTVVIILILSMGSLLDVGFEKAFLLQNNLNLAASEVIQTYVYKTSIASGMPQWSYSAAIGLLNSVISFLLIVLVNYFSKRFSETTLF